MLQEQTIFLLCVCFFMFTGPFRECHLRLGLASLFVYIVLTIQLVDTSGCCFAKMLPVASHRALGSPSFSASSKIFAAGQKGSSAKLHEAESQYNHPSQHSEHKIRVRNEIPMLGLKQYAIIQQWMIGHLLFELKNVNINLD